MKPQVYVLSGLWFYLGGNINDETGLSFRKGYSFFLPTFEKESQWHLLEENY